MKGFFIFLASLLSTTAAIAQSPADRLYDYINNGRISIDHPRLRIDQRLETVADDAARRLARANPELDWTYDNHRALLPPLVIDAEIFDEGYESEELGIAAASDSRTQSFDLYQALVRLFPSAENRKIIFDARYEDVGIGVARRGGRAFVVVILATELR